MQKKIQVSAILVLTLIVAAACGGTAGTLIQPAGYVAQFGDDVNFEAHTLVDVRTPEEFAEGYIAGAININVEEIEARMSEIPKDKPVVVYCRSGRRSAIAAQALAQNGYEVYDLGGILDWTAAGLPLEQ